MADNIIFNILMYIIVGALSLIMIIEGVCFAILLYKIIRGD